MNAKNALAVKRGRGTFVLVVLLVVLSVAAVALNREERPEYRGERYDPPLLVVASYLDYADRPDTVRDMISFDPETGLPVVDYGLGYLVDNAVSTSQWGLQGYSRWVTTGDRGGLADAVKAADWLTMTQDPQGAWVFDFPYDVDERLDPIPAGWVSGMAQGQAMSLLVRLYRHTADPRYLDAAKRALAPLTVPTGEGGALGQLDEGVWFEINPAGFHVLNAHLYTLIGLWDLAPLHPPALEMYDRGRATLETRLERWDLGRRPPLYDLRHERLGGPGWYVGEYDKDHEGLLLELLRHRPSDELTRWAERWFPPR